MITLGIETSCDETGVGITNHEKILANAVRSQLIHARFGGIVPELAARDHVKNIVMVLNYALAKAELNIPEIDLFAYTRGPGLLGALLVGSTFAKALGISTNKPTVGVSHIESHIYSLYPNLKFPILILLTSGGHTELIYAEEEFSYNHIGTTLDDACGEAFDKTASRVMGLSYPWGPEIEKLAQTGDSNKVHLPLPKTKNYDFSFSGLKTAVLYYVRDHPDVNQADLAASFQDIALEYLLSKTIKAAKNFDVKRVGVVGGVSANQRLRSKFRSIKGLETLFPESEMSTDNGAMVAYCGLRRFEKFGPTPLDIKVFATKKGLL